MVISVDKGRVKATLCRKITAPIGVVEAEAKAFEASLPFAKDIGIHDVIFEGDSLIVYNSLYDTSPPLSSIASVVQGMQEMSKEFRHLEFSHVRRQGNRPAHLLAKHVSSIVDYIAWIEEV